MQTLRRPYRSLSGAQPDFASGGYRKATQVQVVALHVKTTGLSVEKDEIIELAGVKFTLDNIECGTFERLTNPGRSIPREATAKTGISPRMVKGAQPPLSAIQEFFKWIGSESFLVAHNAPYHAEFILKYYKRHGVLVPRCSMIDTLTSITTMNLPVKDNKLETLVFLISAVMSPTWAVPSQGPRDLEGSFCS